MSRGVYQEATWDSMRSMRAPVDRCISRRRRLIASACADWQKSWGNSNENGLLTVYDKGAETLSNGKF
ncbi:hypothetical protein ABZY09_47530 [Streptomyces sp. NPDC002928]|uniref:hypothetical protein n=1 Tax=Streptomyces sp. NPDC002928 TaxID=3154440 RepID=UPI0033A952BC